jgi:2-iminobutanoate/2-iminopropanoate deaminase
MVRAIDPSNFPPHKNPIPAAAIHRGILISSVISGKSAVTDAYPEDKTEQISLVFKYIENIISEAGGIVQDIIKVDLYFRDKSDRLLVNPEWEKMFPNPKNRPARHAQIGDLPENCCLQVTIMAVIDR